MIKMKTEVNMEEEDGEEFYDKDMEVWAEDLRAKFIELEDNEVLSMKEQANFNEQVMDVLTSIIVNMRIMKEEFKMFENVYKLKDMTGLIAQFMGIVEETEEEDDETKRDSIDNTLYA